MSTYLITGATRGIGREVARLLADDDLILMARDANALDASCAELPSARPVAADLADPDGLGAALDLAGRPDRLDGIVHSAGANHNGQLRDVDPATWTDQLVVNVVAVAELTRLLLPALRAARGTVVLVNSGAGRAVKREGGTPYAASKHALVALAAGLRLEEPDVRVTTVYPGRVATDMQRELRAYEGGEFQPADYLDPVTVAGAIVAALRLPGDAEMTDVALMPSRWD